MRAYRAGTVAVANAFGTGVADDKAIYHYVPEMIRFYLNEEPILDNVKTYLLTDPEQLEHVLGRLDELVVKPTGESGGKGVFIGPATPPDELAGLADVIRAHPERWIAQELVNLSTVPTAGNDGRLAPRHVDLRPFAVFGEDIKIVPGGLTRVALIEGSMIVNSSRGGGSKDTWVLEDGQDTDRAEPEGMLTAPPTMPDLRYGGPWVGQQQQQQQQCSPGSPTNCSGSGATSRAPSTPRACSTASSRPRCRAAPTTRPASPSTGPRCSPSWARRPAPAPVRRDEVLRALTLEPDNPTSVIACIARAREGARTVRDVISAEMWEAVNTTNMRARRRRPQRAPALGARTRSTTTSRSAARSSGA